MKRWLLFVLLFGLLFATVGPVSAAGSGRRSPFNFVGRITEIGDGTIAVEVLRGNKLAKPSFDQTLTVAVADTTCYLEIVGDIAVPITFDDLEVGDPVSVHGMLVDGIWTASRITVGAKLIHYQ